MGIIKEELIKKVREYFDLNVYEAKVWITTLYKGICSAGEISEISGVPRSRTYDVLESLEKKGFVMEKVGKPVKYIGIKPAIVIEKMKNNLQKEIEEKLNTLDKIKDTEEFEEIESLHEKGINLIKSEEISGLIKGKSNLNSQLREIIENSEESLYMAINSFELKTKLRSFFEIFSKLKKRGVKIKIIIPENKKEAESLSKKLKVEIKTKKINGKFVISDAKEILLIITNPNENTKEEYALWVNSPFFAASLIKLFDIAWESEEKENKE
ncbi:MAG: helix-turn-helix domain-containing protein [Candidatus Pacearchaeota archaeon]